MSTAVLRNLKEEIGEVVARHARAKRFDAHKGYRHARFIREVLGERHLFGKLQEIADAVEDHRLVVVYGCNGSGKDWLAGRIAQSWVYTRGGLAILSGPTERQVREILMRREVARPWRRAKDLHGELRELGLRIEGHEQSGILAFTATDPDKFAGHHSPAGVLVVLTEGQGIPDEIYEAALSCMTGDNSRMLVVGNPLRPSGKFYEISRSANWKAIRISAFDHPNVQQDREIIPGAVTREFVGQMSEEYGEASPIYKARVLAEFPEDAIEGLVRRDWLERAARLHEGFEFEEHGEHPVLGVDVARQGADATAVAVMCGRRLLPAHTFAGEGLPFIRPTDYFATWHNADLMETTARVSKLAQRVWQHATGYTRDVHASEPWIAVDTIGLGAGVADRLREMRWRVAFFNSAQNPKRHPERYLNRRAESYFELRRLLEYGEIAIPRDARLWEELLATEWQVQPASGRIQIESKDTIRRVLGRSPDVADCLAMAVFESVAPGRPRCYGIKR